MRMWQVGVVAKTDTHCDKHQPTELHATDLLFQIPQLPLCSPTVFFKSINRILDGSEVKTRLN